MGRLRRAWSRIAAPRRSDGGGRVRARVVGVVALVLATAVLPTTSASFTSTTSSTGSYLESAVIQAPTGLTATLSCPGGAPVANLSWTPSTSTFATGYHVTRVGGPSFDVTPGTASATTDTGLADRATYDYTVTSTRSTWSSPVATTSLNTDCAPTGATGAYLLANTGGAGGKSLVTAATLGDTNPATNEANLGTGTGINTLNDLEIEPATGRMVAAGNKDVGTISPATGLFTRIAQTGTARGADGTQPIAHLMGLAFDASTGWLWAVEDAGAKGAYLLRLDPVTGQVVPGAFGAGVDYVVVAPAGVAKRPTDLAVNPLTGQLLVVLSSDDRGRDSTIVRVAPATGSSTVVAVLDPYELDGLDVDGAGQLWATGSDKADKAAQLLLRLDGTTGSVLATAPIDNGGDYRGVVVQTPPTWVASSALATPASGSVAVRLPAAAVAGDLALAWVGSNTTPISAPAGWTKVRDVTSPSRASGDIATNGTLFWRVVGASDPNALFSFTAPGATTGTAAIFVYRGARLSAPVNAESGLAYDVTTSPAAAGVATSVTGTRLVALFHHEEAGTISPPGGMAERFEAANADYTLELADEVRVPKGATGGRTATASVMDDGIAVLVALAPG